MMVQIGVQISFTCYCYTFGGEIFHQKKGGPIGDRLTMAVALLVMEYLWRRLREIVDKSDPAVYLGGAPVTRE